MKYKKNNGFTLIELLAIIVILAIIAVITVPIILSVIENARKGAAIDSAYGYKDAIEKYYLTELAKDSDFEISGSYNIGDNGKLVGRSNETNEIPTHLIPFSGAAPSEGIISIKDNEVKNACLVINGYKIKLQDEKFTIGGEGSCEAFGGKVITGTDIPETGHTGVEAIVYLDPTDLATECDEDIAASNVNDDGSPTGVNTGCMKWYVIEELSDDDTYTMILDHNTTAIVDWISEKDYKQEESQSVTPSQVGVSYGTEDGVLPAGVWNSSSGTNNRGPITLLQQLKTDTSGWVAAETLTSSDTYTAEWEANSTYSEYYTGNQKYTINYSGYKARLISAEEVERIIGINTNTVSDIQGGRFDSNCISGCRVGTNEYGWLFDHTGVIENAASSCESYGCNAGLNTDSYYWTLSPRVDYSDSAWVVISVGLVHNSNVNDTTSYGVRPLIKVSKFSLIQ